MLDQKPPAKTISELNRDERLLKENQQHFQILHQETNQQICQREEYFDLDNFGNHWTDVDLERFLLNQHSRI